MKWKEQKLKKWICPNGHISTDLYCGGEEKIHFIKGKLIDKANENTVIVRDV